ncbi:hypothetical protein PVK06_029747 [Gossypium arboreum]|uniref:Uncharacterized protein n=1 Tax=Gossypium arboreum TaxID=29729 RepID=A0ABR0NNN7_GOSAR|nr:hypothetical protein PVK06_029747 [Gossypium arboreum]
MTKLVVATFCMKVKFPTPTSERYIKVYQRTTRVCHIVDCLSLTLTNGGEKSTLKQQENNQNIYYHVASASVTGQL